MNDVYRIFVIDDERIPMSSETDEIVVELYKNSADGLAALKAYHAKGEKIEELWLDHDLGFNDDGEDINIMPVVSWLEEQSFNETPLDVGIVFVHTANPYAGDRMVTALNQHYTVVKAPLPLERDHNG